MKILGIETSCDETSVSVVENGVRILSLAKATSANLHTKTGGIVPEVAARKQTESMIPVLEQSLKDASLALDQVDSIAVARGPGLVGSLLVGVETARALSLSLEKPLIPVNHLVGHIYANFLKGKEVEFPAVALVVSGGHTDLVLMKNHGKFMWLGGTRDDAAGEAFDKVARVLGLGYPGGPEIEGIAKKGEESIKLPRPMIESNDFDMSFSGLKTAVINLVRKNPELPKRYVAYEFQEAITDVLVKKLFKAVGEYLPKSVLLAGGVAANKNLREKCEEYAGKTKTRFFSPPIELCMDNAAFIASAAFFNNEPLPLGKIKADPSLNLR